MRSSQRNRFSRANRAQHRSPATPEANARHARSSQNSLQRGTCSTSVPICAHSRNSFKWTPTGPFDPRVSPKTQKIEKVKTRNEVNLTSDNYRARDPRKRKKVFFPNEPNLSFGKYAVRDRAILSLSFDTLLAYVSDPRRPASSSPPSGFQNGVAGPGLIRFCKSNERMPAAVPAGFLLRPVRLRAGRGHKKLSE
jgi:hypothetical protein